MLVQSVQPCRVAEQHFFAVGSRNAGQRMLNGVPGIWISGCNVRKVRFPQDVVNANTIAQFDSHGFEPEIDVDLTPKQFARARANSFRPKTAFFPFRIARFQNRAYPSQPSFRENPVEPRESFQHAREKQVGHELSGRAEVAQRRDTMRLPCAVSLPSRQRKLARKTRSEEHTSELQSRVD